MRARCACHGRALAQTLAGLILPLSLGLFFCHSAAESGLDEINLESSCNMPPSAFIERVKPKYFCVHTCTGPEICTDFPVQRSRFFGTALSHETFVWVGPDLSDPAKIQKDFEAHFGVKIMLDADCFAGIDGLEPTAEYYKHLWRLRGVHSRAENAKGRPFDLT